MQNRYEFELIQHIMFVDYAQTIEEAKEMRRQQASQIVVPGMGGGNIQMP